MADLTVDQLRQAARRAIAEGDEARAARLIAEGRRVEALQNQAAVSPQGRNLPQGFDLIGTFPGKGEVYRAPDGRLTAVSEGGSTNDQETIRRIMGGETFGAINQERFDQERIEQFPVAARAATVAQGLPFVGSYTDELLDAMGRNGGNVVALQDAMRREKPVQALAGNLAGGVLGSLPMIAAAGPTIASAAPATRTGQVALGTLGGATAGGIEGAVYGSGEAEGRGRAYNAKRQGLLGALLGGVVGGAAPMAADAAQAALTALKRSDVGQIAKRFNISKEAATVIRERLDVDDIAGASQILQQSGPDAMLAEISPSARSLLDSTAAMGGQARNTVDTAIGQRVNAANDQFRGVMDAALGPAPSGLRSAAEDIAERTAPQRQAAYTAAYNTPIDYADDAGRAIEDVIGRVPPNVLQSAIADANEDMLARQMPRNMQIMAQVADDGSVSFVEKPNVQQLDEIKKALQRIAFSPSNQDAFGRTTATGDRYNMLAGQLRDATGGAAPAYRDAVAIGGDKLAEDRALKMGSDILSDRVTREDVVRNMAGASVDARAAAAVGLRQRIDEVMANTRRTISDPNVEARQVQKVLAPLSSEASRTKIAAVIGQGPADDLFAEVDRIGAAFNLRASVSENSRTAARTADREAIQAATGRGVVRSIEAGEPLEGAKRVAQLLSGEDDAALKFRQEGVANEIAQFLTGQRGRSAQAALEYVNKAVAGQRLTDAQANFVAQYLTGAGFFAGSGDRSREAIDPFIPRPSILVGP